MRRRSYLGWIVVLSIIVLIQFAALLYLQYGVERLRGDLLSAEEMMSTRMRDGTQGLTYSIMDVNGSDGGGNGTTRMIAVRSVDFTDIIERSLPSVVIIRTDRGLGSGVVVSDDGYVVTNAHVVLEIQSGYIRMHDNSTYEFDVIAEDIDRDLALLKIREPDRSFMPLQLENARDIRVGEPVVALGSPAGLSFTATAGIVSARRTGTDEEYVQTDVPINPGNSGGPLIDMDGRVIGINTFKSRGFEGLGFAIESDVVRSFVEDAIAKHK